MAPRLLVREDPEVSELVAAALPRGRHQRAACNHKAHAFVVENGEQILIAEHAGREVRIPFDAVLVAVGRVANITGYGLEELGVADAAHGRGQRVSCRPAIPNIYAAGDVAGPYQFTHTAAHQAWYAAVNALFDPLQEVQGRLLGDPLGHLRRSRSGARRTERDTRQRRKASPTRSPATASTTWTGRLPTARRTASSRC